MRNYIDKSVGQIVAEDFSKAAIFEKYSIDFCCNGADSLEDACLKSGVQVELIIKELNQESRDSSQAVDFQGWPLDLLSDYILKYHHRNIRTQGPEISTLLDKVCNAHGAHHPELLEVRELFNRSMEDLYSHLEKEEMMLFPHIYDMFNSQQEGRALPDFHCGTVAAPISVMMHEHNAEGERYFRIADLTNGYEVPSDGCGSYRLLMNKLKEFNLDLHQHIHLENNILFPIVLGMESGSL